MLPSKVQTPSPIEVDLTAWPLRAFTSAPAFSSAISTLFTRLGCPLPMPSRRRSRATVIALLLTCFTQRQAKRKSSSCSAVGCAPALKPQDPKACKSVAGSQPTVTTAVTSQAVLAYTAYAQTCSRRVLSHSIASAQSFRPALSMVPQHLRLRHNGELDILRRQRVRLLLQPAACRAHMPFLNTWL